MSTLLDTPSRTAAQRKADQVRRLPASQFAALFQAWRNGVCLIWDAENPQDVLDEIGTDGAELFSLSAATAAFLESLKPNCTTEVLTKLLPFTVEEDGGITITVE